MRLVRSGPAFGALMGTLPKLVLLALCLVVAQAQTADAQPAARKPAVTEHTVEQGETVRSIAASYGVNVETVLAANALEQPDLLRVGQRLVVPSVDGALHTVAPGESLHAIAERYAVDLSELMGANDLSARPDELPVGSVLVVPGATLMVRTPEPQHVERLEHTVERGETLGDIAWRYSVDATVLLEANGLADPDYLVPGTALVVPGGASRSAPPPATPTPVVPKVAATATPAPLPVAPSGERTITAMVSGYALGAGAVGTLTRSGKQVHWGTVAADIHLYPFGTRLRIEGLEGTVFVVEDTGSAVRGNIFDVWFPDVASARAMGYRARQVTILPPDAPR
jgi:LysM repeat protein